MSDNTNSSGLKPRTLAVRAGQMRSAFYETSEALYLNSGYVYSSAQEAADAFAGDKDRYVYSRYGNPRLCRCLKPALQRLRGRRHAVFARQACQLFSRALACQLQAGDRIVASRALFGACYAIVTKILPRWGVQCTLVNGHDLAE